MSWSVIRDVGVHGPAIYLKVFENLNNIKIIYWGGHGPAIIDSNLSKRIFLLIFCYRLIDSKFAFLVPILPYKRLTSCALLQGCELDRFCQPRTRKIKCFVLGLANIPRTRSLTPLNIGRVCHPVTNNTSTVVCVM